MSAFPRVELDREPKGDFYASLSAPGRIPDSKFSSAAQSPPTLCDPTDGSTPGFPKVVEGLKFGSCFLTSCVALSILLNLLLL